MAAACISSSTLLVTLASGVLLLPAAALAQSGSIDVSAQANIFGYGLSAPGPAGGGGGVVAPTIALTPGAGRTLTVLASGQAGWSGSLLNGPDGGSFAAATNIPGIGPISGFAAPLSGHLVGVFIPAGDISALVAPGNMAYPDAASLTNASYAPGLRQVFFIGDGQTGTGSGATQVFTVPDEAAVLVLGIADGFGFNGVAGYYGDNVGQYTARFDVVPGPGAAAVLIGGAGAMGIRRRRR